MPPKSRIEREEILNRAFELARREGFESLTARRPRPRETGRAPTCLIWKAPSQTPPSCLSCPTRG